MGQRPVGPGETFYYPRKSFKVRPDRPQPPPPGAALERDKKFVVNAFALCGGAPKVEIPPGQEVTFIDPEYATCRWTGIQGNWKKLLNDVRDPHWVMVYGDYLEEIGYAAPRIGVTWETVSER